MRPKGKIPFSLAVLQAPAGPGLFHPYTRRAAAPSKPAAVLLRHLRVEEGPTQRWVRMEESNRRQNQMLSPLLPSCYAQTLSRCGKAGLPGKTEQAGRQGVG